MHIAHVPSEWGANFQWQASFLAAAAAGVLLLQVQALHQQLLHEDAAHAACTGILEMGC